MASWLENDKKYVWHPFTQMQTAPVPLEIVKAKDAAFFTAEGNKYIDINSSWWVNVHGHGNEYIGKALSEQFSKIDHTIFADATHHKAIELAERVCNILPNTFQKVFFSDNGSTAVEVALKMVVQFWYNQGIKKNKILALDGAYHGDTFGAMSVGQRGGFNTPFEPYFFEVDFLDFPSLEKENQILEDAHQKMKSGDYGCLIVEPLVQGSAGMRMYRPDFLDKLVRIAKDFDVKVIFDEVMTAWGRTGKLFAMNHCTEIPDIVCLSKGLTGGTLPLGLTVATDEIYNAFLSDNKANALLHGHSFTGNSLACACACASLDIFEQEKTWMNIDRISKWNEELQNELKNHAKIDDIRFVGTILAIELKQEEGSSYYSEMRGKIVAHFLANGIFIRPLGNIFFFNPPYCITDEELQQVKNVTLEFLETI